MSTAPGRPKPGSAPSAGLKRRGSEPACAGLDGAKATSSASGSAAAQQQAWGLQ